MPHVSPSRRDLLRGAVATTVVGSYASASPSVVRRPGGAEMLKVGLIGCGGRGTGAAVNALRADPNVKLWALADTFADHLESSLNSLLTSEDTADLRDKIDVPPERRFTGWDAYKGVIESCDVVLPSHEVSRNRYTELRGGANYFWKGHNLKLQADAARLAYEASAPGRGTRLPAAASQDVADFQLRVQLQLYF